MNVLVIRLNLTELYERLFYGRFEWCMCVCVCVCVCEEMETSRIQVFPKQTRRHRTSG